MNVLAALREFAGLALGRRRLFRVRGASMEPTLRDGDLVIVNSTYRRDPVIDSIVVATEPESGRRVVKRVRSRGNRTVALGSDNPLEGRDSRHFGSIAVESIEGPVTWQIATPRCLRGARP